MTFFQPLKDFLIPFGISWQSIALGLIVILLFILLFRRK